MNLIQFVCFLELGSSLTTKSDYIPEREKESCSMNVADTFPRTGRKGLLAGVNLKIGKWAIISHLFFFLLGLAIAIFVFNALLGYSSIGSVEVVYQTEEGIKRSVHSVLATDYLFKFGDNRLIIAIDEAPGPLP